MWIWGGIRGPRESGVGQFGTVDPIIGPVEREVVRSSGELLGGSPEFVDPWHGEDGVCIAQPLQNKMMPHTAMDPTRSFAAFCQWRGTGRKAQIGRGSLRPYDPGHGCKSYPKAARALPDRSPIVSTVPVFNRAKETTGIRQASRGF
jgi:hypothetical protein